MSKQTVKTLTENELVDLIDSIVQEAVAEKLSDEKKKWLAEHKSEERKALLEKIQTLQSTVNALLKS